MAPATNKNLKKCDALRVPSILTSIHRIAETSVLKVKIHNEYTLTIGRVKKDSCEDSLVHDILLNLHLIYQELKSLH
jgi:hypothetical protein